MPTLPASIYCPPATRRRSAPPADLRARDARRRGQPRPRRSVFVYLVSALRDPVDLRGHGVADLVDGVLNLLLQGCVLHLPMRSDEARGGFDEAAHARIPRGDADDVAAGRDTDAARVGFPAGGDVNEHQIFLDVHCVPSFLRGSSANVVPLD